MDTKRFDDWARARAQRLSRRQAMGIAGSASLAGVAARVSHAYAQDLGITCTIALQALTSAGPSFGQSYTGQLEIDVADDGAIDTGFFTPDGGLAAPAVGNASGRSLSLRVTFPDGQTLVFGGTGDQAIDVCSGAISGAFSGPQLGDTGSWIGILSAVAVPDESAGGGDTDPAPPLVDPTACPEIACEAPLVFDEVTCICACPDGGFECGLVCCPSGSVCTDASTGECGCPEGTELCGNACVPSCEWWAEMDYNACTCVEWCELRSDDDCQQGYHLTEEICLCELM